MSGWDLAETAQSSIGDFWTVTRSQVYRELAWMAEAGLVEAGERGAPGSAPVRHHRARPWGIRRMGPA